jgi:membrane protein
VWLQTSWMIVMAGAELSRAVTEIDTFGYDPDYAKLGVALRRLLALRVMQCVVRSFAHGERAPTAADLSAKLEIPGPLVRQILAALHEADLVAENAAAGAPSYQPVRDVACYSVLSTVAAMERRGINDAPPGPEPDPGAGAAFAGALQQFAAALEHSPANRRLIDIGDGSPECRQ